MDIRIVLHFAKGYIGNPYWPELERLINIQKESGVNRAKSQERRDKTLRDYLGAHGMTMDDYSALQKLAVRPFYTADGTSEIVIPAHQVHGCFANSADLCSASIRIARPEQIRTVLSSSDLTTGKTLTDAKMWSRFVVVKGGTGKALSNQRSLRENEYLEDFDASGQVHFIGDKEQLGRLRDFLVWAGREIGLGASRKQGWGRFEIEKFEVVSAGR